MTATTSQADEATARMADGTILRTLRWRPPREPRARALVVHGLGEHAGRCASIGAALSRAGIDVHAYDQRGFGGSAGRRADVDRWSRLHDDLQARLAQIRGEEPSLPLVLYGHSMGGLVALGYVLADPPRPLPDLLVLSAPGIDSTIAAWKRPASRVLRRLLPRLRIADGIPPEALSRDPAIAGAVAADPRYVHSSTVRLGAEGFDEQDRVRVALAARSALPVPTYVLHGSADAVVPVEASAPLAALGGVTRRVHEGLRHEPHHEPEREAVLAELVSWLDAHLASAATPPSATGCGDRVDWMGN